MSQVIAIANPKGGVGKTTTAINLAAAFAMKGLRTLLIDLDPSGAASLGTGFTKDNATYGVFDLYKHPDNLTEELVKRAIYSSEIENLQVMTCNVWTSDEENMLLSLSSRLTRLRIMINYIRNDYAYVIIDCPPFLSNLTMGAFTAADSAVVPVQCGFFALNALDRLMKFYKKVKETINPYFKIDGIVLTMYERGTNISIKTEKDAKMVFQELMYDTYIPKNVKIGESAFYKKPVITMDPSSAGAKAYIALGDEILARK